MLPETVRHRLAQCFLASALMILQAAPSAAGPPELRQDEPDLAAAYQAAQRFADGKTRDPIPLYEKALEHMAKMPRFSTHLNRELPPSGRAEPISKADLLGAWQALGPGNIGGRTRALLIDPDRPRIRYAAGVSGGIWKTEDGGRSWNALADLLPNITVSAMVMDPSDPRILYAGTGEGVFREVVRQTSLPLRGAGIYKSTDGGETWERLQATRNRNFHWVNDLAISHNDPRRIYAATRSGVWRTRNAGRTWERILAAANLTGGCFSLALRSDRPADQLFASCGTFEQAKIFRNPNAAASRPWTEVLSEAGMGRTTLALAPSNQNVIYALSASYLPGPGGNYNGGLHAVYRSDGAGNAGTWEAVTRNTDPEKLQTSLLAYPTFALSSDCGTGADLYVNLGWYAQTLAVDPLDPNVIFLGGVNIWRSDNGGRSWGVIGFQNGVHVDQHTLVFHPRYNGTTNQTLFAGNDGGIWRTGNARGATAESVNQVCNQATPVEWTSLNNGYGVTQFYHGSVFPDASRFLGGTQDNGTLFGSRTRGHDGWIGILGGDGGYSAIDPRNPNVIYAEAQGLAFFKSTDGGFNFQSAMNGIGDRDAGPTDDTGALLFIVPFTMDPNAPDRLWYGGRRLWRTDNGADSWSQAAAAWPSGAKLSAVAVAPGNSNRVAAGLNDGSIHISTSALASTATTVWPGTKPRNGFVSWVTFDPSNPNRVYATYATFGGKHLWASDNAGRTWRAIDGSGARRLPNLPAHTVVVDPDDPNRLYVGTDLGVFVTRDRGRTWSAERTGFANVVTETLTIATAPGDARWLYAFTHGRGAFRVRLGNAAAQP